MPDRFQLLLTARRKFPSRFPFLPRCSYAAHERLPSTVTLFVGPTTKLPGKLRERGRNEASWNESIVGLPSFRGLTHGNYLDLPLVLDFAIWQKFSRIRSYLFVLPLSFSAELMGTTGSTSPVRSSNHDSIAKLSYSMTRVRAFECLARTAVDVEVIKFDCREK